MKPRFLYSQQMDYAFVNGKFVPSDKATISIFDRGIVLGDGLFETLRAIRGLPEFFPEHFARLRVSAGKLKIKIPVKQIELKEIIKKLCKKSRLTDAVVRITLTRGKYTGGLSIDRTLPPSLIVSVRPLLPEPSRVYTKGVAVAISSVNKSAASGLDPTVKSTNYLANIFAKAQAERKKCYEAILLGENQEIAELSTSSFFCVIGKKVYTPPIETGILPGITRQKILSIMEKNNISYAEKSLYLKDIPKMSEAFLTSSVRGVVPIRRIERIRFNYGGGKGGIGEVTRKIQTLYQNLCQNSRETLGD